MYVFLLYFIIVIKGSANNFLQVKCFFSDCLKPNDILKSS